MNIDKVMALMPTIGHETQAKIRTALEQLVVSAREGAFCEAADAIGGLYSTKPQGLAERVEALAERVEALERANGGYVLAKPEDVDARVAQAARAGLAEMMSALRVLVREEIAASAKNTGDAEASTASTAQRPPEVAGASPASPSPDEVEALARELQRVWEGAACPSDQTEWHDIGAGAQRGYLAEARYVLSRYEPRGAGAGAPTTAPPLPGGEGVPLKVAESFSKPGDYIVWRGIRGIATFHGPDAKANAETFASRAPRPVSVEAMAERLLNAQLKHYGLSPRAWAQVDEEERAYWLALARAAIGGGG